MFQLSRFFISFSLTPFLLLLLTLTAHLSFASQHEDFDSSNSTLYPAHDLSLRGIRGASDLEKRQCTTGGLYCPLTSFCCIPKYSCCSTSFCCAPGYACYAPNPCVFADVVTVTFSSTQWITSRAISTIYAGTSTSWSTFGITQHETITSRSRGGTSTSTIWVTVTTTQVLKRAAATEQPTSPTSPPPAPFLMEGQTPLSDILYHALEDIGLLRKRAITSYESWIYTSITTSYSYYTVQKVVTSVTTAAVKSTLTSVVVDDAVSTSTVTSTTTSAVIVKDGQQQQQGGGGGSASSGLSVASMAGIGVSVGCSVLGLLFAVCFKIFKYRKQKKEGSIG